MTAAKVNQPDHDAKALGDLLAKAIVDADLRRKLLEVARA